MSEIKPDSCEPGPADVEEVPFTKSTMSIESLPLEVLYSIVDHLLLARRTIYPGLADLAALIRSSRYLASALNHRLYRLDAKADARALFWACHNDAPDTAERALSTGLSANHEWVIYKNFKIQQIYFLGFTPLWAAGVSNFLSWAGMVPGAQSKRKRKIKFFPLQIVALSGSIKTAKLLLDMNANPNTNCQDSYCGISVAIPMCARELWAPTSLTGIAIRQGHIDLALLFLDYQARFEDKKIFDTMLEDAAAFGTPRLLAVLIDGELARIETSRPLFYACAKNNIDTLEYLLSIYPRDSHYKRTVLLSILCDDWSQETDTYDLAVRLIKSGARLDRGLTELACGSSPLHFLQQWDFYQEQSKELIRIASAHGMPLECRAVDNSSLDLVEFQIDNRDFYGKTPLIQALVKAESTDENINAYSAVISLLELGADCNARDTNGDSMLFYLERKLVDWELSIWAWWKEYSSDNPWSFSASIVLPGSEQQTECDLNLIKSFSENGADFKAALSDQQNRPGYNETLLQSHCRRFFVVPRGSLNPQIDDDLEMIAYKNDPEDSSWSSHVELRKHMIRQRRLTVETLLDCGADVNCRTEGLETCRLPLALLFSCMQREYWVMPEEALEMARFLIKKGTVLNESDARYIKDAVGTWEGLNEQDEEYKKSILALCEHASKTPADQEGSGKEAGTSGN